jgi:CSLREA domain-containing protein
MAALPAAAGAATITPNITGDEDVANADCSLREAVTAANTDGDYNGCNPGGSDDSADTIILQSGQTYSLSIPDVASDTMNLNGDLDARDEPLTIEASGAGLATIDANGDGVGDPVAATNDRVLEAGPPGGTLSSVTLNRLAITDGAVGAGAGIWANNVTSLSVNGSRIFGNSTTGNAAGAIRVDSGLTTITDSSLDLNSGQCCGAIFHESGGLTITRTTISHNTSTGTTSSGGAIYKAAFSGPLTVTNSTLVQNSSKAGGGAIESAGGTANLSSDTIVSNVADSDAGGAAGDGGGVLISGGTMTVRNSIIGNNEDGSVGPPDHNDCSGTLTGDGYNEIYDVTGCTLAGSTTGNIAPGTTMNPFGLGPHGGLGETIALDDAAPALNAGNPATPGDPSPACPATDQRGEPRGGVAGTCDIGAYEVQPPQLAPIGPKTVQTGQVLGFTLSNASVPEPGFPASFSAVPLPAGATLDSGTGAFSWTAGAPGSTSVQFRVSDGLTVTDSEDVEITVTPVPSTDGGGNAAPAPVPAAKKKCKKKAKKKRSSASAKKKCKSKKKKRK